MKYKILIETTTPLTAEELSPLMANGRHVRLIPIGEEETPQAKRRRIEKRRVHGAGTVWTTKEETLLARYKAEGLTYEQIAEKLGRTKSSVMNHADRMKKQLGRLKK